MNFYVIAPHNSDPEFQHKKEIVNKAATRQGVTAVFAIERLQNFNSEESLIMLKNADFVIADLSCERPSCYYEVGYAQALRKPVILIASLGTQLHQVKDRSDVRFFKDLADYQILIDSILDARVIAQAQMA